jgi:PEP-CTERM motif
MGCLKTRTLWAAICAAVLCGADAQAGSINYLVTETFTSSGTSLFTSADSTTTVLYTIPPVSSANVPPANNVSLGTFTTASSSTTPVSVSDTFTLTIADLGSPTLNSITYTGTMSGTISGSTSTAFVQFNSPLTQTLDGFVFTIVSADLGIAGRLDLNAPTTNGGVSSINAIVNAASTPEPSSVVLLGLAVPALAGLVIRRARS